MRENSDEEEVTEILSVERGYVKRGDIWGCRIRLADNTVYIVPLALTDGPGCAPGDPVDEERREEFRRGQLLYEIKNKALDLLDRRDHSRFELKAKLEKSFGGQEGAASGITRTLDELSAGGWINDRRFAENWLYFRMKRRPEGPAMLKKGLAAKGISRDIIARLLDSEEGLTEEEIRAALDRAGEKLLRNKGVSRAKLIARLQARGFSYVLARDWANQNLPADENDGFYGDD